ncbi:MAG TPA: ribonuclease III [Chloroflexia bacterium]|nr:ribonuclease III [Chloroflexia bacterium]
MADPADLAPEERQGEQQPAPPQPRAEGAGPRLPLEALQESLGYRFQNEDLLRNALTHKSYLHAVPDAPGGSNERLEFLGDSVLGFIVSTDLFLANPDTAEGQLTTWRGALVRLTTLAKVAEPLELGEYMFMSKGEESAGGRARGTNLGRAVEALLGAVYLDGGMDAARSVWHAILGESGLEHIEQTLAADYKTQLQQYTQATMHVTPSYRLVDTSGPDHAKLFRVAVLAGDRELAKGMGTNKQSAEQAAAEAALQLLHEEATAAGEVQ